MQNDNALLKNDDISLSTKNRKNNNAFKQWWMLYTQYWPWPTWWCCLSWIFVLWRPIFGEVEENVDLCKDVEAFPTIKTLGERYGELGNRWCCPAQWSGMKRQSATVLEFLSNPRSQPNYREVCSNLSQCWGIAQEASLLDILICKRNVNPFWPFGRLW